MERSKMVLVYILLAMSLCSRFQLLDAQIPQIPGLPIGGAGGIPIGAGGIPAGSFPAIPSAIVQQIVDTFRTGTFSLAGWAIKALSNFIPAYTTLMIPTNDAIAAFVNFNQTEVPSMLLYHVVSGVLPFNILSQFPIGQRLPTMLFGNQLVVTDNSDDNFSINGAKIVQRNMCGNTTVISCHGIDRVLNPRFNLAAQAPGQPPVLPPALSPFAGATPAARAPPAIVIPGPAIAPGAPPATVSIAPAGQNETESGAVASARLSFGVGVILCLVSCFVGFNVQ